MIPEKVSGEKHRRKITVDLAKESFEKYKSGRLILQDFRRLVYFPRESCGNTNRKKYHCIFSAHLIIPGESMNRKRRPTSSNLQPPIPKTFENHCQLATAEPQGT